MTSKHTPAPWWINPRPRSYEIRAGRNNLEVVLLHVDKWPREAVNESHANASLIAAAPDLLYALQEFVRNPGGDHTEEIALAAIAKATGVQP